MRSAAQRRPGRVSGPSGLAAAAAVALALAGCGSGSGAPGTQTVAAGASTEFDGAPLPPAPAPGFTLSDQAGRPVSLAAYRGRVVVVSFLYTRCGAPCVLIAQQIRGALDTLARPPAVLIVSADPAGDTPARARRFLAHVSLSGRAEFLSGPPARVRAVWRAFRIVPAAAGRTEFARHAIVLLVDRAGRSRVEFGQEQLTPEALAHDIGKLQGG